jgi:hypothetical protein
MKVGALLITAMLLCGTAHSTDAYFVRFNTFGRRTATGNVIWLDDILFYNTNTIPVGVKFVGVSNGAAQEDLPTLTLPPGQTISLNATQRVSEKWMPIPVPPLWVLHLDIPSGVVVESRDEYYVTFGIPELFPFSRGKVSMPVFRELVPGGKVQVHVGTDLSGNDSRVNVGIYNAAGETASATIEVRRACDGALVDSRTICVAPNNLVQIGGMLVGSSSGCLANTTQPWARYTLITVTQPSITFVSNLNENLQSAPGEGGAVPIVGLAVSKSQQF